MFSQYWHLTGCFHNTDILLAVFAILTFDWVFSQYWHFIGCFHNTDILLVVFTILIGGLGVFTISTFYWLFSQYSHLTGCFNNTRILLSVFTILTFDWMFQDWFRHAPQFCLHWSLQWSHWAASRGRAGHEVVQWSRRSGTVSMTKNDLKGMFTWCSHVNLKILNPPSSYSTTERNLFENFCNIYLYCTF